MYHDYFDEQDLGGLQNPYAPPPPPGQRRSGRPALVLLSMVGGLSVGVAAATGHPGAGPAADAAPAATAHQPDTPAPGADV